MRSVSSTLYDAGARAIRRLRGLPGDRRGNVLMLWAIFLIPLIGVIGSAVDVGRAYVTRNQMQTACDAAALAGRRAMSNASVDAVVKAEAVKFFNFNFAQGVFGSAAFTPNVTSATNSSQTVVITAATTVPTTFMRMFGYFTLPVGVTCNASQDFVNTDIVLVLDTTGSMNDKATSTDTSTKIVALRAAVLALYDQLSSVQTQLQASGLRLRYGVVPYASAVNVGKTIFATNSSYMLSGNWTYQSRQVTTGATSSNSCNSLNGSYKSSTGICTYFKYLPRSFDTTAYVAGSNVDTAPLIGTADSSGDTPVTSTTNNVTWAGCIEERQTVQMASTAASIPSGAYDLDIDLIPYNDATRWKPYWPQIEYTTYQDNIYSNDPYKPQYACPTAAAPMQIWARTALSNYLDTLNPDGGTYHDNGMMWGARWDSANGIFGPQNPDTYNSMPVKKYIIFMTDGLFDTGYSTLYSSYGVEQLDARVTPGGSSSNETDQLARHKQRFALLCSKAKSMGYSVWVIGFATTLDSSLTNCASTPSQASTSSNQAALLAKFVEIGKNIGALRLTQ
ncbi:MAG: TadE/TadG family type IV pilus assembly protein [Sphingomonas sp.]